MKISKFVLGTPDSSDDMRADIEFVVDNPTKSDIHKVQYCVSLHDEAGVMVGGNNSGEEDCLIEPGEDAVISPYAGDVSVHFVGDERDNVKVRVNATLYAREFHRMGEIDAPAKDNQVIRHAKSVKSALIDGELVIMLLRTPADESGDVTTKIRLGLRNLCDKVLPDVLLRCRLLDRDGSEAESSQDTVTVRANGTAFFDTYLSVKKSKLKGAKMAFDLTLFHPVHVANCDAVSTPEED